MSPPQPRMGGETRTRRCERGKAAGDTRRCQAPGTGHDLSPSPADRLLSSITWVGGRETGGSACVSAQCVTQVICHRGLMHYPTEWRALPEERPQMSAASSAIDTHSWHYSETLIE